MGLRLNSRGEAKARGPRRLPIRANVKEIDFIMVIEKKV